MGCLRVEVGAVSMLLSLFVSVAEHLVKVVETVGINITVDVRT